jgi:hypothetical protein
VAEEAKLFGVGSLPGFKGGGEGRWKEDRGEEGALACGVIDIVAEGGETYRTNEGKDEGRNGEMRRIAETGAA